MYPSDYVYTFGLDIDDTCYNNGYKCQSGQGGNPYASWMHNEIFGDATTYTMTPITSHSNAVVGLQSDNPLSNDYSNSTMFSLIVTSTVDVFPVAYLKSNIRLGGGDGSKESPYTIAQ